MTDSVTADDARYEAIFSVSREAEASGMVVGDLSAEMSALREKATVQKGSLPGLLGLPVHEGHYTVRRDCYTIFSFEGCDRALRDNITYSSEGYRESTGVQTLGDTILWKIGEDHRSYRAVAQPMFIQPRVAKWWRENWIDEVVGKLLDNIDGKQRVDLNLALCARMPVNVITPAMGMQGEDALTFRQNLIRATFGHADTPEDKRAAMDVVVAMLRDVIGRRRASPADDVISGLILNDLALPGGGSRKLTDDEIISYCRLIMNAGGGTTWRQLGITLVALLSHEGYWQALRQNRELVGAAVQESLRWLPTDPVFPRLVTRDVEVEGVTIPAGMRVDLCLGAANRDPVRWVDPDCYDIFRPYQYNLGVGIGPHQCLGAHVARQEMICAINGLLDRFPDMRLDLKAEHPRVSGDIAMRGMTSVPVLLN
jgi:cytochrome P450